MTGGEDDMREAGQQAAVVAAHRQHLAGMHLVWRMAKYGPGPDTSPETTLETIAHFAENRIRSIEEQLPHGYYEEEQADA